MIMKYPDKEFFFCRVTEVIWVLKHFANQVSSYLIPTFTGDESPASRHDFFQKLAYRLCMSGVIFSRMVLQRKKYFQWSTSRWVGNVNSLENAIKGRLLLKKNCTYYVVHTIWQNATKQLAASDFFITIECGQNTWLMQKKRSRKYNVASPDS